jgi:hypothetical protein
VQNPQQANAPTLWHKLWSDLSVQPHSGAGLGQPHSAAECSLVSCIVQTVAKPMVQSPRCAALVHELHIQITYIALS